MKTLTDDNRKVYRTNAGMLDTNKRVPCLVHVTTVPASLRTFFGGQIAFMKAQGLDVRGISSPGPQLDEFQKREDVEVKGIRITRNINPARDLISLVLLWIQILRWRPMILHGHTPKGGVLGLLAAWSAGVPVRIYHIRGLPIETARGWRRWLLWISERLACKLAHRVLCISESVRLSTVRYGLCPIEKTRVLGRGSGNGVDSARRFHPDHYDRLAIRGKLRIPLDSRVMGYVGRIARDKGIEDLTRSWQILSATRPELHWIVAGERDERDPISRELYCFLRNDPRVHILGFVSEMPEIYAAMDVCVLPTYREGFPNVLLEAAAMGLPVVATRVTGCVDAVEDTVSGTLVPSHDPIKLGAAIASYLDDVHLRSDHGRAGRRRVVRDFLPDYLWTELYEEYKALLQQRGLAIPNKQQPEELEKAA